MAAPEKENAFFGQVNYDGYVIQTNTKNFTFVKMYRYLKSIGVKNNKFFLRLYDKDLMNVDPYDKKLSKEIKAKILVEIVKNPFYYLREVIRIPAPGAAMRFELHRGNLAEIWAILNSFNTILLLPRQRGKTMSVAAALTWIYHFGTINSSMLFSNKSVSDATNNLKRFKDITALLPSFIRESIEAPGEDINNIESINSARRNNSISTKGQPSGYDIADKQGRGMTVPILWFDEFAFLKFNSIVYKSAGPAQSKAAEIARENGKPYCRIITTTPNNLDSEAGSFCYGLIQDSCEFMEEFYDWTREDVEEFISNNSSTDFLYIKFTWRQLGLDDKWYRKECRSLANDQLVIKREIDLEWTKSSDNSVFSEEQLEIISNYLQEEPIDKKILSLLKKTVWDKQGANHEKYVVKVYREINPEKSYIVGVDSGGGTGRDNSAFTIVDPEDLEPVAVFKNNKINIAHYSDLLEELVTHIIPNATLVIERNSYGKAVIDTLLRRIPEKIFFDYKVKEKDKTKRRPKTETIVYGLDTTPVSRDAMIDLLMQIADDDPSKFGVKEIYDEIKTLIYNKRGKVEHELHCHDDVLFSYLFVRYVFAYSNNIAHFFRKGRTTLKENAQAIGKHANGVFQAVTAEEVNQVEHVADSVASLTLQELLEISEKGISPIKYLKKKNSVPGRRDELKVNLATVSLLL